MGSILTSVALGWLGRRVQELGSIATFLFSIYSVLPTEYQQLVWAVLTGQGGVQSIGVYAGFAWWLWTQRKSWLATTRPQVVTSDGQKIEKLPANVQATIEAAAVSAPRGKTLMQLWAEKMGRH